MYALLYLMQIACKCLGNRRRRSRARLRDRSNASSRTKEEVLLRSEEEVMKVLTVHNVEKDYVGRLEPCIICLDEYKEGDEVCSSVLMHDDRVSSSGCESDEKDVKSAGRLYNCKHSFHRQCILQWLRVHDDCPVCRRNLINLELGNNNIADGSSVMADDNSCSSGSATLEEYAQDEESNHIDRLLTISLGV